MLRVPYIVEFSGERSDAATLSIVEVGEGKTMNHRERSQSIRRKSVNPPD